MNNTNYPKKQRMDLLESRFVKGTIDEGEWDEYLSLVTEYTEFCITALENELEAVEIHGSSYYSRGKTDGE